MTTGIGNKSFGDPEKNLTAVELRYELALADQQIAALRAERDELREALRLCQRAILGQRTTGEAMVAADAALSRSAK